jgi:hypothetical protein
MSLPAGLVEQAGFSWRPRYSTIPRTPLLEALQRTLEAAFRPLANCVLVVLRSLPEPRSLNLLGLQPIDQPGASATILTATLGAAPSAAAVLIRASLRNFPSSLLASASLAAKMMLA